SEADQTGRRRGARSGAGTARALLGIPGIAGHAAIPDVAIGERADAGLAEQHGTCIRQLADDRRGSGSHAAAIRLRSPAGSYAGGIENVLGAPRNAVQRPEILAALDGGIG